MCSAVLQLKYSFLLIINFLRLWNYKILFRILLSSLMKLM